MKPYLPIVGLIIIVIVGYQLISISRFRPTVSSFDNLKTEVGYQEYDHRVARAPMTPIFNGRFLACSAKFSGGTSHCDERMRGLREGSHMEVTFVELPSTNGSIRVATKIVLDSGEVYFNSPQNIIREWNSESRETIVYTVVLIISFFILLPALLSPKIRRWM